MAINSIVVVWEMCSPFKTLIIYSTTAKCKNNWDKVFSNKIKDRPTYAPWLNSRMLRSRIRFIWVEKITPAYSTLGKYWKTKAMDNKFWIMTNKMIKLSLLIIMTLLGIWFQLLTRNSEPLNQIWKLPGLFQRWLKWRLKEMLPELKINRTKITNLTIWRINPIYYNIL